MLYADAVRQQDNRDLADMERYYVSRIEAMKREIQQLRLEVAELQRQKLQSELAIAELVRGVKR